MNIAILGYGQEGQAVESYFQDHHTKVFDNFTSDDLPSFQLNNFNLVFRSPSLQPPQPLPDNWTSSTRYFFKHCPCPIIGVTGTKGKGTTCSLIARLLAALGHTVHLVGNIGIPAISALGQIAPSDIVVYELSSFQLWDLNVSPHLAVVLRVEPDHLNIHRDFDDYVTAKSNITRHQTKQDFCIYYHDNPVSTQIAELSPGTKLPYPTTTNRTLLDQTLDHLAAIGAHNRENAEAALLAVSTYLGQDFTTFLNDHQSTLAQTLSDFTGLPHRLEFVRELNNVKYYDDSFSSAFPALDVALKAFEGQPTVLIAGGKDRGLDLTATTARIFSAPNLTQAILIGETKQTLAKGQDPAKYQFADNLTEAVQLARTTAEAATQPAIVLMSPGAASFDMFKNFADRGEQFQAIVNNLK